MMDDKIIRDAIKILNNETVRIQILSDFVDKEFCGAALHTLLSLAQNYLKFSGSPIVPEEKELKYQSIMEIGEKKLTDTEIENENVKGFNACRHEVLLRMAGFKNNLAKLIFKATVKQDYPCIKCDKRVMKGNLIDCLCIKIDEWNEYLASAIVEAIQGDSDVKG